MKLDGILNPNLIYQIASLGHFDTFVICDMGFPIPKGPEVIDITLTRGIPNIRQAIRAVLMETVVQEVIMTEAVKTANPGLDEDIRTLFNKQEIKYLDFEQFREKAASAKFIIRTAEDLPCSNIMFVSASGVLSRVEKYKIDIK